MENPLIDTFESVLAAPSSDQPGTGTVIENLDSKFALSMLATKTFEEASLDSYSDDELLYHIRRSPSLVTTREEALVLLSHDLIAKLVGENDGDAFDELLALRRAREIGILVPAVRRIVRVDDEGAHYLIMERVHGLTLEQLWPNFSWWATLRAAWQLRTYLRLLRAVTSQTTGGLHSGRTHSEWLQDQPGPIRHASPAAFVGYLNWWLVDCRPSYCTPRPDLVLEPAQEHTLVHQDLAPRNMILDRAGKLWLVDWGHAGFYPAYMEYFGIDAETLAMSWITEHTWAAWWGRLRWRFFRWIAAGSFYQYRKAWRAFAIVSIRTQRFRLDRTPFSDRA